jgi:hypothetical protein
MKSFITFTLFIVSSALSAQEFRNSLWNDSKTDIKSKETAYLISEITKTNYVEEIHYVQVDSGYAFHIYYVFRKDQLFGIKTQRLQLAGQNTKFAALEAYKNQREIYEEKYGKESIKERNGFEQAVRILEVRQQDRELYVTIEKNGNEYFLVENIFKIR